MSKAKVYFTREITPEAMVRMYKVLELELPGRVAVKVHSGEVGNQNFLRPDFMKPIVDFVSGRIVEGKMVFWIPQMRLNFQFQKENVSRKILLELI